MTPAVVVTLIVVVPLLALWAAHITAALSAETDIRDDYGPGALVWVWVNVPSPARLLDVPRCPPMHYLPLRAEVRVGPALLYGRPPADVEVLRAA